MAEAMGCEGRTQLSLRTKFIPLTYTPGKGFSTCHWSLFYLQCLNCLPASQGSLYVLLIVVSPLIDCVVVGFFNCHPERHCKLFHINISDGKKNLSGARKFSINTVGKQQGLGMLSAHLIPQLLLHLSNSGPTHRSQWVFSLGFHRPFGPDLDTFITSHRARDTDKGPREIFQVA